MPTLSSVPEEHVCEWRAYGRQDGTVVCHGCNHAADVNALINQQIKSVLDELENEAIDANYYIPNHPDDEYTSGEVVRLSTIQKIRSRYE